jgi:hypothetical protein
MTDQRIIDTIEQPATRQPTCTTASPSLSHYLADFAANKNALGVFMEPRTLRENLIVARAELDRAIAIIDAANWPTARDYNQV